MKRQDNHASRPFCLIWIRCGRAPRNLWMVQWFLQRPSAIESEVLSKR